MKDDQLPHAREAREHRQEILQEWQQRRARETVNDERLKEIAQRVARKEHHDASMAIETLTTLLWLLADVSRASSGATSRRSAP